MTLPKAPVTLSPAQIATLNQHLADMRHDINNHLALILAAVEIIRKKPDALDRMIASMAEQPAKITTATKKFSADFEQTFGITRP